MRSLLCRLFSLAVLGLFVAALARADDVGTFRLDDGVQVGGVILPSGAYVFRASVARNVVLVYDEKETRVVAAGIARREALSLDELERSGTLAHDWAVRALALGRWEYSFFPGEKPLALVSRPEVLTTVVASAR